MAKFVHKSINSKTRHIFPTIFTGFQNHTFASSTGMLFVLIIYKSL